LLKTYQDACKLLGNERNKEDLSLNELSTFAKDFFFVKSSNIQV
jgi:hypothetical protein